MNDVLIKPSDIRTEAAMLGQILVLNSDIGPHIGQLSTQTFFDAGHQNVYESILALWMAGKPITTHAIETELRRYYSPTEYREIPSLVKRIEQSAGFGDLGAYVAVLKALEFRRDLLHKTQVLSEMAYDESLSVDELQGKGVSSLMKLMGENVGGGGRLYTAAELWEEAWGVYQENANSNVYGIPTGFYDLDRLITGFLPGQLILVAARPGMGKTTFMFKMLRYMATHLKKRILFISLEMTSVGLTTRLVCNMTGMDYALVRKGKYDSRQAQDMAKAKAELEAMPMNLYYTDSLCATTQLSLLLKSIYARNPFDLVMIDYLGLFSAKGMRDKVAETTAIVQAFKGCAINMDVPVVSAVQLSRAVEQRADKHPQLSDLRDSGALEQTADIVLSLYRPGYYDQYDNPDVLEVGVLKQRDGQTGVATLGWDGNSYDIYNRASQPAQGQQSNYATRP